LELILLNGDNYKYDIVDAKSAGMIPILYNRKNSPITTRPRDFIEVKSMEEIENLIKEI
jgi:FMN phosphatase YigB (HAD superfamily)